MSIDGCKHHELEELIQCMSTLLACLHVADGADPMRLLVCLHVADGADPMYEHADCMLTCLWFVA